MRFIFERLLFIVHSSLFIAHGSIIILAMEYLAPTVKQLLNLDLTSAQINSFRIYAQELAAWNEKFNLTAIKEPKDVEIKHFADSLSCLLAIRNTQHGIRLIDVGTGAGLPRSAA